MEQFLVTYGAIGIFLGAAFEGQTAVIIGGLLARQNLISLWVALLSATAGSALIDHLLFVIGRRFRSSRLVIRMAAKPAFLKALGLIERFPVTFMISFRFIYGLRAVGPVAIGISTISTTMFTLLNILSAVIWASVFTAVGYLFGQALEQAMGRTTPLQRTLLAVAVLVIAVGAFTLIRRTLARRRARQSAAEGKIQQKQP
jgi:membrane protein DedA with SNARE-associated domain